MTAEEALDFIRGHGIVLASANGPVPKLTEAIAGAPVRGSWWSHPKGREIFRVMQNVTDSPDVLVCRLVGGKITFVHRRLWPALVRVADRFSASEIAQVHEEHTANGQHVTHDVSFPKWVPHDVMSQAKNLDERQALAELGSWSLKTADARPAAKKAVRPKTKRK